MGSCSRLCRIFNDPNDNKERRTGRVLIGYFGYSHWFWCSGGLVAGDGVFRWGFARIRARWSVPLSIFPLSLSLSQNFHYLFFCLIFLSFPFPIIPFIDFSTLFCTLLLFLWLVCEYISVWVVEISSYEWCVCNGCGFLYGGECAPICLWIWMSIYLY